MKYGFSLIVRGREATPETFDAMAREAEALGLDSLWASDHLLIPPRRVSRYPGTSDGEFPAGWLERYWEQFAVLTYLSGRTSTVTLGTSVCILPMHHPIEVAAKVAHLDQLANGRFVFGVGVGWFQEEFEVLNWPFHERGARATEGLQICKALWTQAPASFHGQFYRFDRVHFGPKPASRPHTPIWVGGHSPGALKRVAKVGNGWHPFRLSPAELRKGLEELRRHVEAAGRSMTEITVSVKPLLAFREGQAGADRAPCQGSPSQIADDIKRYQDLGVEHLVFDFSPETRAHALETMERFAQEVRGRL
jgi:probable F420-dependent oxidoreductase